MNKKTNLFFAITILVATVVGIASCKKADIKFGEEFLDNNGTQIFKVDSFSATVSTVFQDSFVTSARSNVMIGSYVDPVFGKVTTQSYFEIAPPAWADLYQNTYFDSLTLILKTNGNYYGDSTQPITINIKELADSIKFPDNVFAFYNTSKFAAKPTPLATYTTIITPKSNQTIKIKLPNYLGNDFLNKLKDINDNTMKSTEAFLKYFKGLQITTDAASQMIFNCSDNIVVQLSYRKNAQFTEYKTLDFNLINKSHQFNNIHIDRTGTALQNLSTLKEIPSTLTGNAAYTQSATGSLIKISFPTLKDVPKIKDFAKVLKASLIIKPVQGTYSHTYYLPPTLRLSTTNINNNIGADLAYITANGSIAAQLGNLNADYFLNQNTQYQYDLTEYLKEILNTATNTPGEGMLLCPQFPNYDNQFARVVIGNSANALGKIELHIYYATIK